MLISLIIGGCGQEQKKEQQPGKNTVKPQVKPGGPLVYGSLFEPNTLNPLLSDLLATAEVGSLIFSGLVTTNDKGEWQPDLAAEVPALQNGGISSDGLTVTYRLRPNVSWHDGVPFTADDVKFTWQVIMNSKVNVVSREGYDKIVSIDTPNSSTVVIKFKEYYAPFMTLFSTVLPKHCLETVQDINKAPFNRAPVGTGPFRYKEWNMAESVVLEANTAYYRGKPNLEKIIYKIIPDANLMLTQLKAGEVDVVSNIAFAQYDLVKGINGVRAVVSPNMIWEHLDFNLDNPLFQDVRVRQAVALALDRPGIINNVLKNVAAPAAADQSPLSWAYNPNLSQQPRNLNSAKELLAQAGWKPGQGGILTKDGHRLSVTLALPKGNVTRDLVAQEIAQQLKEAGIEMEIRPIEAPVFFDDVLKNRRFDMALYAWVTSVDPDNMNMWNSKRIPGRGNGSLGQNYCGWRNPEVDKLTEQGAHTIDIESRKQIYFRIQDILSQEYPVIPLYFRANIDAVKNTVLNYRPNPTPAGNLWNAWEWGFAAK